MKETMYDYVKETPAACRQILEKRKEITRGFVERLINNEPARIVFVACGSSYNAAISARLFVEKVLCLPVSVVTPFMFTHYESCYGKNDMILAISQSGRSTLTIDAVKKAVSQSGGCMVLTNNADSPITKQGGETVNLSCGVETVGFVTKGYASTILDLMLIGLESAYALKRVSEEEYRKVIGQIERSIELMPQVIEAATQWYQANKPDFMQMKRPMVVGCGPNLGTALEGALKIQETICLPSTAFELEEFMHGPNLELSNGHTVFFVSTSGKGESRIHDLAAQVARITDKGYLITSGLSDGSAKILSLPHENDEEISPLFLAIPFQLLSYFLSMDLGIDLSDDSSPMEDIFSLSKVK